MKCRVLLGIIALVPAALNIAPAAHGMTVALCTGDGAARTITLPTGGGTLPGKEQPGCCAKACHTGSRKKSQNRNIDTRQ